LTELTHFSLADLIRWSHDTRKTFFRVVLDFSTVQHTNKHHHQQRSCFCVFREFCTHDNSVRQGVGAIKWRSCSSGRSLHYSREFLPASYSLTDEKIVDCEREWAVVFVGVERLCILFGAPGGWRERVRLRMRLMLRMCIEWMGGCMVGGRASSYISIIVAKSELVAEDEKLICLVCDLDCQ
jgi:hypothetical protein